jgi:hypothetical protein
MIKNLTGHVRFRSMKSKGFYQQTTLTRTLIISLVILSKKIPNFPTLCQEASATHLPTFRYKHTARRLASNINLYMACYKTPHFLFQRTLFLFHVHFPCYIFLFPLPRRKGDKYGKVDRLPLPFHNLYHDTILPSARSFR